MYFVCSGKNRREFERLCKTISEEAYDFDFYVSGLDLLKDLTLRKIFPDLIILEYKSYRNFGEVMYELLKSQGIKIPIVIVGSDVQTRSSAARWISENEFIYDIHISFELMGVLQKIENAIKSGDFFIEKAEVEKSEKIIPQKYKRLPPVENKLLNFFYQNKNREISIEEIEKQLEIKSESKRSRKNVVYSYIARLRKEIKKYFFTQIEIIRIRKGFYQLLDLKETTDDEKE